LRRKRCPELASATYVAHPHADVGGTDVREHFAFEELRAGVTVWAEPFYNVLRHAPRLRAWVAGCKRRVVCYHTRVIHLRDYQRRAVADVQQAYGNGSRSVLLVLPTGAGKTTVASELCRGRGRVLWIAHRRELIAQADARLESFGITDRIVVSVQSLTMPGAEIPACDFAVYDEAHHLPKDTAWASVGDALRASGVLSLGLTATPQRADGKGLGGTFDKLIVGATPGELMESGHLCTVDVHCVGVAHKNGIAMTPREAWERYGEGRRCVVFCRNVKEATEARDAWGDGEVIHGTLSPKERERRLATDWRVLFNVYVLTEGWDAPSVKMAILARTCGSIGLYLQIAGRILRPHEGQTAVLVDLMGTAAQHGHPCETHEYSLGGKGIATSSERLFVACAGCGYVLNDNEDECPRCKLKRESRPDRKARELRITNEKMIRIELQAKADEATRLQKLAAWITVARVRGYKPGYPSVMFSKLYGRYPTRDEGRRASYMTQRGTDAP
jgi:DNA repair protein RadD